MTTRWAVGVAVGAAAALGAGVGYVAARRDLRQQPGMSGPERAADATTTQSSRERVIRVTPRQVQAARVAIEARKLLGEQIPPGLQRIANAGRKAASRVMQPTW